MDHVSIGYESPQLPPGGNRIRKRVRHVEPLVQHICRGDADDGHIPVLLELHTPVGPARGDGDAVSARSEPVREVLDVPLDSPDARFVVCADEQHAQRLCRLAHPRGRGSARIVSPPMKNEPNTTCTPSATKVKPSAVAYSCPSGPKPCRAQSTKIAINTAAPATKSAAPASRPCSSRTRGHRRSSSASRSPKCVIAYVRAKTPIWMICVPRIVAATKASIV